MQSRRQREVAPAELVSPLRRDVSCRRDLLWRCDLGRKVPIDQLVAAMAARDYEHQRGASVLVRFRHCETDHSVLYVPSTGRVQVRLDGLTPHDGRVEAAASVFASFAASAMIASGASLSGTGWS